MIFAKLYQPEKSQAKQRRLFFSSVAVGLFLRSMGPMHAAASIAATLIAKFHYTDPTGPDPTRQSPRTLFGIG